MDDGFMVTTIVAVRDRRGYIKVRTPEDREPQMTPETARELAMNLLEAAEAAEADARFYQFAKDRMHAGDEDAQLALLTFRAYRVPK